MKTPSRPPHHHRKTLALASLALALTWLVAWTGYSLARNARATAERLRAYVAATDLSTLAANARAQALRELADRLNALPPEERRRARLDESWRHWFDQMTEQEKATFIDATMPQGFHQMLAAFEQLPSDRRRRAVQDSLKRLKQAQDEIATENPLAWEERWGTNGPPLLSEDLQHQITRLGLKTFYAESSAATKAELAPVLEEMQRLMESGRLLRRPHP